MYTAASIPVSNNVSVGAGKVLGYTIIVTEDYTKNTEGDAFLPGWRDVQKFSVWPPYQVRGKNCLKLSGTISSVCLFIQCLILIFIVCCSLSYSVKVI
jgi:hypothetical protein